MSDALPQRAQWRFWLLVAGFFLFQLFFEALNEALVSLPGVPHGITMWSVTMQFACCSVLPLLLSRRSGEVARSGTVPVIAPENGNCVKAHILEWTPFAAISAMVFAANGLSQYSTHYVEFTLKIVAKSSKLLPTMLIASMLGNAGQYASADYAAAFLLCTGTAMFSYGGGRATSGNGHSSSNAVFGMLALGISCLFDGFVPNAQQRLMRTGVSASTLMARTNAIGAVGGIAWLLFSPDVAEVVSFAREMPKVMLLVPGIGFSLAASVLCYTELIESMGSVFTVGVATLRKSVSLLLSYLLFAGKSFSGIRALGLMLVASGLMLAERQAAARRTKSA